MPPGKMKEQQSGGHTDATIASKTSSKKSAVKPAPKRARKSLALDPTLLQSSGSSDDNDEAEEVAASLRDARGQAASNVRVAGASGGSSMRAGSRQTKTNDESSGASRQRESPNRRSNRLSGEMSRDGQASESRSSKQTASQKRKTTQTDSSIGVRLTPPDSDAGDAEHVHQAQTAATAKTSAKPAAKKAKAAKQPIPKPVPTPASDSDSSDNFAFTRVDPPSSQIQNSQQGSQQASTSVLPGPAKPVAGVKRKLTSANRAQPASYADNEVVQAAEVAAKHQPSSKANAFKQPSSRAVDVQSQDRKGKRKAEPAVEASQPKATVKAKKGRTARADDNEQPGTPTISEVAVYTQETPAIQRNLAMRAGMPPGTPGSLARRSSADMRGRRGSSIGNGFEALPHPSLPSDTLYRHIKTDDPPAIRFRTLVTWAAHRMKDRLLEASVNSSKNTRDKAMRSLDGMISDIVEKRIDLTWTPSEGDSTAAVKRSEAHLPPNPQNEANAARLRSCQAWTARLQAEDEARNARINAYKSMTERITRLTTVLPPAPVSNENGEPAEMPDLLQPNWHLPIPRIRNKEDALAYGRKMLEPRRAKRKSGVADATDADPDVIDIQQELGIDLAGIAQDAAEIHQMAYRIDRYLKLSDTFLNTHLARSHLALTQLTRPSLTIASANTSHSASLSDFMTGRPSAQRKAVDHRSLLRAIARADMAAATASQTTKR